MNLIENLAGFLCKIVSKLKKLSIGLLVSQLVDTGQQN
jgi:hypothetical protein